MSLSNGNETIDHTPIIENLLEKVKGFKRKEGWKAGKCLRSWVEKQAKTKTKITGKDNVGKSSLR
jgi:hypothetical protein